MGKYLGDKPYDLAVVVFDGDDTANEAFDMMKAREERTGMKLEDAAVFSRTESGKIKLHNKGFVGGWKGGTIGLGIGLLLGGPVGGALVGSLIGFGRSSERRELRDLLDERLGPEQSALAIVVENGNRDEIAGALGAMGGEAIYTELQGESLAKLEELADDDDLTAEAEEAFDEVSTD
jgi:uncharacterized membrane protein